MFFGSFFVQAYNVLFVPVYRLREGLKSKGNVIGKETGKLKGKYMSQEFKKEKGENKWQHNKKQ